jgi:hypothetical protein
MTLGESFPTFGIQLQLSHPLIQACNYLPPSRNTKNKKYTFNNFILSAYMENNLRRKELIEKAK